MDISRIDVIPHQHVEEVRREEVEGTPVVLHATNCTLITFLLILLPVKHASWSPSFFVTDHGTMLTFIAVLLIYICSWATVKIFRFPNPDLSEFMNNIILLFGSLAPILLLLVLVRAFGFFTLSLWILYFLIDFVTKKSYRNALGYFWDKVKELFKGLKVKVKELFKGLKVKVKELLRGRVKNEAENAEGENAKGLQEAGEQTTVAQLQDMKEIIVTLIENKMENKQNGLQ